MSSLRAEVNAAEGRGQALSREFEANEAALSAKQTELEGLAGTLVSYLVSSVRLPGIYAGYRNSLASAEYPGRAEKLSEIAQARALPTRSDLDQLPKSMLLEMIAQSEVKSFEAPVEQIGSNGESLTKEVFRIGIFTAATTDETRFSK